MRRYWVTITAVWVGTVGFLWAPGLFAAEAEETSLAAEGLLHSAMNLYHTPGAPARAGRLVAISRYLTDLDPQSVPALRLLADIDQSQGDLDAAVRAARALFDADPDDHTAGLRWLRFRLLSLNRAEQRTDFLRSVLAQKQIPSALRSVAATEWGRVLLGQGAQNDAAAALRQALELDPLNHTALIGLLELTENPTPEDRAETMLAMLKGNPRAYWVARELAGQLAEAGLYDLAMQYELHAWALWRGDAPLHQAPAAFACEVVSTLLDADKPSEAVERFAPAEKRLKGSIEFLSLMIEAYRKTGQAVRAEALLRIVEEQYRRQMRSAKVSEGLSDVGTTATKNTGKDTGALSASAALHLAWFSLLLENRPAQARKYVQQARTLGAKGPAVDLAGGAADLAAGRPEGLTVLRTLAPQYPLAAAYVAEYEFDAGQTQPATESLLAGLRKDRRNLAYRRLAALAKQHNVPIPSMPQAQTLQTLVNKFDPRILDMGLHPEHYIRITLRPLPETVALCEPMIVEATLTNIGALPVPVGAWGLLSHQLGLDVGAGRTVGTSFASMPMVLWPAPRYLPPGKSVSASARVDIGPIARYLANHSLLPVTLTIRPIVSPREEAQTDRAVPSVVSDLPTITLSPVSVQHLGLLTPADAQTVQAYQDALASIRRQFSGGDVSQRLLAARRVAALLAWIRDAEQGRAKIPAGIQPVAKKKTLLETMKLALRDPADVVRAEMVTALEYADLGAEILNEIALVVDDPSPLVRFRVAELVGASATSGNRKLVEMYAKDPDPNVRLMARAFLHAWAPGKPPAPSTTRPTP